jgi:hypothetical protein
MDEVKRILGTAQAPIRCRGLPQDDERGLFDAMEDD